MYYVLEKYPLDWFFSFGFYLNFDFFLSTLSASSFQHKQILYRLGESWIMWSWYFCFSKAQIFFSFFLNTFRGKHRHIIHAHVFITSDHTHTLTLTNNFFYVANLWMGFCASKKTYNWINYYLYAKSEWQAMILKQRPQDEYVY